MTRADGDEPTTLPRGLRGRLRDIVDRSIGMYLFRRLTGRPTRAEEWPQSPPILSADEVAYRIGAADRRPRRSVGILAGVPTQGPMGDALRRAGRAATSTGITARGQLLRDTSITVAGLAVVALIAAAIWQSPDGAVLGVTSAAAPDDASGRPTASPAAVAVAPSPAAPSSASEAPVESSAPAPPASSAQPQRPVATGTGGFVPASRPRPSSPPRSAPTPTPQSTFGPSTPTPSPTFGPPPTPTPSLPATPTPTPNPQPIPTLPPGPTPTPTPDPTPTPTPTPTRRPRRHPTRRPRRPRIRHPTRRPPRPRIRPRIRHPTRRPDPCLGRYRIATSRRRSSRGTCYTPAALSGQP